MRISLMLDLPVPATKNKDFAEKQDPMVSVEEEVRSAIEAIESGHDSAVEWKVLNKFARTLRDRKDSRSVALMKMIEPVMNKYGMHGVSEGDQSIKPKEKSK